MTHVLCFHKTCNKLRVIATEIKHNTKTVKFDNDKKHARPLCNMQFMIGDKFNSQYALGMNTVRAELIKNILTNGFFEVISRAYFFDLAYIMPTKFKYSLRQSSYF